MKSSIKVLLAILLFSSVTFGQEITDEVKSLSIGAKLGVPNIITANIEYVSPLLDNRVAITADYMSLSKTVDDVSINYNNFEIGANIYLNNKGKGLYASISYFSFDGEGTFTDIEFDTDNYDDGTGKMDFSTVNLKLGAKLGNTFYFRIEAGYGFGDIPEFIEVTAKNSSQTTSEEIPEIPGISDSGLLVFNLGIGFSFL